MEMIQGEALEFASNPMYDYESAISTVAAAAKDADGLTLLILQDHLKQLCEAHMAALKD